MRLDKTAIAEIADEYVLGLLDQAEAEDVEAEMEQDADLRQAIAVSRERFLPLDTEAEPATVGDGLWQRIEVSLPPQAPSIPSVVKTAGVNDNRGGWRTTALAAMAASLLLVTGLAFSLLRTVEPVVIAVLLDEAGRVQAVVEDFGNETANVQLLADFDVPADKTIQVWTLPSREMGPISLGLIDRTRSARLDGPTLPRPGNDQLYELTLEQAGGSPTGRPTGPILAKGFAKTPR